MGKKLKGLMAIGKDRLEGIYILGAQKYRYRV